MKTKIGKNKTPREHKKWSKLDVREKEEAAEVQEQKRKGNQKTPRNTKAEEGSSFRKAESREELKTTRNRGGKREGGRKYRNKVVADKKETAGWNNKQPGRNMKIGGAAEQNEQMN